MIIKWLAKFWLSGPRYSWSRLYRFLVEKSFLSSKLPTIDSLHDIRKYLKCIKYHSDSIFKLFDSISYPETVWAKKKDDCDGFAILACKLLEQLAIKAYLYTYIPESIADSHTVCIFRDPKDIIMFSNAALVKSRLTDFTKFKEKYFPKIITDDLRDINFNLIEDF